MRTGTARKSMCCIMAVFFFMSLGGQEVGAEEISSEFRSDIVRLLTMTGVEALGVQMGVAISNQMIEAVVKQRPEIPPKVVAAIKDEVSRAFTEEVPKLVADIVPVYAKHFTHDEIKGLIVFYGTPLGKKSIQAMPVVMNDCMLIGQAWGKGIAPSLSSRIEWRLRSIGFVDLN